MSSDSAPACGVGPPAAFVSRLSALRGQRCLVTGGAGFLGGHIVSVLLQAQAKVRVFDVVQPRADNTAWKEEDKVEVVVGNLLNVEQVSSALAGCWCVIHVASPAPTSRNAALFQSVNVDGTRVLIEQCRKAGVKRFVYTSSASVVFDGRDQRNLSELAPAPLAAMDDYTKSKLAAEQIVLAANNDDLYTTAIRPHGIFGARDPHFLPVLAETGKKGKSKFLIGDGSNLVDFTYVENVAYSHALAAVAIGPNSAVNGQTFFITNREPIFFWEFISRMHAGWGWTKPFIPMPVAIMRPMAVVMEHIGSMFNFRPTFTTQAINYSGVAHYYTSVRAMAVLGYQPPIDMDEAIRRSLSYYWGLRNQSPQAKLARAELKKNPVGSKLASTVPGFGASLSSKVFIGIVVLALFLLLTGSRRALLVLILALAGYAYFVYASSFGAAAVAFAEKDRAGSYAGRSILVTGANRGLGYALATDLLSRGVGLGEGRGVLVLTARDAQKGAEAVSALQKRFGSSARVRSEVLDLSSFASVKALVSKLKKDGATIDVLVHNAGAMVPSALTGDKIDSQWQGNYLASVALTHQMIKAGVLAPAARVVCVSSMMHRAIGSLFGLRWSAVADAVTDAPKSASLQMYCRTKLAQVMWTAKQQRVWNVEANAARLAGPAGNPLANRRTIVSVNPGAVATDFIHHFIPASLAKTIEPVLMKLVEKTPSQGVQAIAYAALSQEMENVGGVYVDNCQVCLPSAVARDEELQEQLWNKTLKSLPQA